MTNHRSGNWSLFSNLETAHILPGNSDLGSTLPQKYPPNAISAVPDKATWWQKKKQLIKTETKITKGVSQATFKQSQVRVNKFIGLTWPWTGSSWYTWVLSPSTFMPHARIMSGWRRSGTDISEKPDFVNWSTVQWIKALVKKLVKKF